MTTIHASPARRWAFQGQEQGAMYVNKYRLVSFFCSDPAPATLWWAAV